MKKVLTSVFNLIITCCALCAETVSSPDGHLVVSFNLTPDGKPCYSASYKGQTVVRPSLMGFNLKDAAPLASGFKQSGSHRSSFNETWAPVWGENDSIVNRYNQLTVDLKQGSRRMDIEFRVYDDGFGFRYIFPTQKTKTFTVTDELTQMAMAGDHTAWWIPGDYDTQEYEYTKSRLSEIRSHANDNFMPNASQYRFSPTGVQTALMLRTDDNLYLNLHEAALVDFPVMSLDLDDSTLTFKAHLTPGQDGTAATFDTPFKTPWRTVTVGEKATDILASNLTLNLNDPCALDDTSWIHPTKYMGVWWEMITGVSSWSYTDAENFDLATFDYSKAKPHGRHGANSRNVRRYIDFAADNGFDQLLVEGWNTGWEDWFGKEKDFVFDFVTPYPDFDIKALNDYAHSRGIKLMMRHETSSAVDNYDRHMDAAYDLMNRYGYDAVKSGYVGNIIPRGEHHYSQKQVKHYLNAVKKAADRHIMVNAHEAARPTGLCRTYPNLVGNESAMGQEFGDMSPQHVTILPFTRLKGGPMDFTPGIFRMKITDFAPGYQGKQKRATISNQLALYVTMYSPLQMAADLPEHYEAHMDAFQFIKDVPVDWSKSLYLDAEPGEFIVAARKDKHGDAWYVGGVTDENARQYTLHYNFLTPGRTYEATIYSDDPDADGFDNPEKYTIAKRTVDCNSWDTLRMTRGGGFAISIKPVDGAVPGNPCFPGTYADPEGIVYGDTVFIYPTRSLPFKEQTAMDCFSSTDLRHWTKHENIISTDEVKWAWGALWAPAVLEKDRRYYLFFGANDVHEGETGGIGVAVSDRPEGPFKDMLGKPLINEIVNGAQPIDQFVFRDKDGSYYMYYGGWGHCNMVKLADDFKSIVPFPDGSLYKEVTPKDYTEGPFMLEKDGKYYFMWSEGDWTRDSYRVAYAIADSPFGPFERVGTILESDPEVGTGAGHHSMIQSPKTGRYYIVYHRHPLGATDGNDRVTCIDELLFDSDGRILPVKMTFTGPASGFQ